MPRQFEGKLCTLCSARPSSPTGEHVWTAWLLSQFSEREGPYTRYINGEPERNRNGAIRTQTSAERVKLPCCMPCNAILDRRFEQPSRTIVRRVFETDGAVVLDGREARTLGTWLLKTWLLLAHPAARSSMPGPSPRRWDLNHVPDDLYAWMITGAQPPMGLSLWIAREDRNLPQPVEPRRLPIPTVVADGRTIGFQVFRCSLRWLDVTLAYHPGWQITQPLEAEDRALRLWPPREAPIDLGSLPPVPSRDTVWMEGPTLEFAPGCYAGVALPAISEETDLLFSQIPGVIFAAAPRLANSA